MATPNEPKPFFSEADIKALKEGILSRFTPAEQHTFIRICERSELDPFAKEIYPSLGGKELNPYPSISGLLTSAERTGNYPGCEVYWAGEDGKWRDDWLFEGPPLAAKCIIKPRHRELPEIAIALWTAYGEGKGGRWPYDGPNMLAKCAKALCLRGAFPGRFSGLFIPEEMGQNEHVPAPPMKAETVIPVKSAPPEDEEEEELRKEGRNLPPRDYQLKKEVKFQPEPKGNDDTEVDDITQVNAAEAAAEPAQAPIVSPPKEPEAELAPEPIEPAWKDHIITSIGDERFFQKKVGEINPLDMEKIRDQWVPKIKKFIADKNPKITPAHHADLEAFESAIAAKEVEKIV